MSAHGTQPKEVPEVLIVGGGLGGLMLALLLECIDVPYHIFERSKELRSLGSAMTLNACIFPVFEQLGLLEDLLRISSTFRTVDLYHEDMKKIGSTDMTHLKETVGYESILFARPKLYELMLKRVPAHKISRGKKVLRTDQKDGRVSIFCSDNTRYEGDILVGADGAYSSVRQSMYKRMDEKGLLPKSDLDKFSIGTILMVGVAKPENHDKYPQFKDGFARFLTVIGSSKTNNKNWSALVTPNNEICWSIAQLLSEEEAREQQFRNSEWGSETNETWINEAQDYICPLGGTMGEIIDATPKDQISKVFLEEKLFKTWYYEQTVLIGDGATNAMQDAVVLANCIFNMPDKSSESITKVFKDYYAQRFEKAEWHIKRSADMNKILFGQKWTEKLLRHITFNYVPASIVRKEAAKSFTHRPQIAWLPLVENYGNTPVEPQVGRPKNGLNKGQNNRK
ncbi:hypothetical protein BGX21_010255 [Mortierella sp. AD011]|nr:hypothetical protein BGX21_010255 [Mortierella sp. AD011]